jgi:hypothetical protein
MTKALQIYYTAVLGALGGLLGWWSVGAIETTSWSLWVAYVFVGAGLGLSIAACVAATDGALVKRSRRRALVDAVRGGAAGAILGALGLVVAGVVFLVFGGGFAGRAAGWMLLGAAIGLSDFAVSGRRRRALLGALGGVFGGLIGGILYESLTLLFLDASDRAQVVVGGVGLVVVGGCIGALIPLARQALAAGELRVLLGTQAGLAREVTDTVTIGRYDGCDLYLPDTGVAWRHALVRRVESGFQFEVLPGATGGAQVGSVVVQPGGFVQLSGGERIRLGEAELAFVGRS